jgi:hypothetical protein
LDKLKNPTTSTATKTVISILLALTLPSDITIRKMDIEQCHTQKKGLNLRACGFRLPSQAFYNIHILEEGSSNKPRTFPGLLIVQEGTATKRIIEIDLNYLCK